MLFEQRLPATDERRRYVQRESHVHDLVQQPLQRRLLQRLRRYDERQQQLWRVWTTRVGAMPLGRCQVIIASQQNNPVGVAVDTNNVYWVTYGDSSNGTVMKAPIAGGIATPLASTQPYAAQIALDGSSVYWTTGTCTHTRTTSAKFPSVEEL